MDVPRGHPSDVADVARSNSGSGAVTRGNEADSVFSLFRRLLKPKEDAAQQAAAAESTAVPAPPPVLPATQQERSKRIDKDAPPPLLNIRQRRLKVAVVGEPESGRTTLCKSLADAAVERTPHPLVVSGHAAALKMDASVLSVQTFNVDTGSTVKEDEEEAVPLEVTIIDSGPAPLSEGAGSTALMEADVIFLCFPLYGIKQVVATPSQRGGFSDGLRSAKATEAFIHTRDYQRLTTLLTLLSTRAGRAGDATSSALPSVLLVGTFQDALKDASVSATHTILRSLQRLCERVQQRSPTMPHLAGVYAVSATQATAVSPASDTPLELREWWHVILRRAEVAGQASSSPFSSSPSPTKASPTRRDDCERSSIPLSVVRHVLGHPNSLQSLSAGMRLITHGCGSPRFLDVNATTANNTDACGARAAFQGEAASAETRAEDARVTSLVVDFVTQLKARRRGLLLLLPLPRLWRVAYALGMQTREQLYLVLRQMEATGEVALLGRGLAYTQQARVATCGATNETVCLCPALLRTSYAILYVYVDWVVRRQQRHVRRCLRGVDLADCAAHDPCGLARKGVFLLPLLRTLAVALGLKNTSRQEAAELLIAVLVGADAAYIDHRQAEETGKDGESSNSSTVRTTAHPHDPLTAPIVASPSSSSAAASPAESPRRAHNSDGAGGSPPTTFIAETFVDAPLSVTSSAADLSTWTPTTSLPSPEAAARDSALVKRDSHHYADDDRQLYDSSFSPNITVAELTSLFLLGELTAAPLSGTKKATPRGPLAALSNASFDPVRAVLQGGAGDTRGPSPQQATSTEEDVVLVVPSLQPSALCPGSVVGQVLHVAARSTSSLRSNSDAAPLCSSRVVLRVCPHPYDLVSLLTCRFASVARRVEQAYANAVLLSFNVDELLHPTTDHVALFPRGPTAPARSSPWSPPPVDGCCFLFCEPPSDTSQSSSAVLQLVLFAASATHVALLANALFSELRLVLLQRLPGMTIAPEQQQQPIVPSGEALPDWDSCRCVEDLIRLVRDAS